MRDPVKNSDREPGSHKNMTEDKSFSCRDSRLHLNPEGHLLKNAKGYLDEKFSD
jgi:hypothetical protein